MKAFWIYIVALLLLGMVIVGFICPKGHMTSYYYQNRQSYHGGTTEYYIYEEKGAIVARYIEYFLNDTLYFEKKDIDRKELEWVDSMLNEANVRRWKRYYEPIAECRDGNNWSAKIAFTDDTITSRGYVITPDNKRLHVINERVRELSGYEIENN